MIAGVKHLLRSQERICRGFQRHPGQPVAEWVNVCEKAVLDTEAERLNFEIKSMVCDGLHLFAISATCPHAASVERDCQSPCSCNTHESVCALPFNVFMTALAQEPDCLNLKAWGQRVCCAH